MSFTDVQTLVLRPPKAHSVKHLVLRVTPGKGGEALRHLKRLLRGAEQDPTAESGQTRAEPSVRLSCGEKVPEAGRLQCSIGFTWHGLRALCMAPQYLQVLARLAPAFAQGAPLRASQLGDSGASAAPLWHPGFRLEEAHVLLTLHGPKAEVGCFSDAFEKALLTKTALIKDVPPGLVVVGRWQGSRLGSPQGKRGEWIHFGYRDGLTDHQIEGLPNRDRKCSTGNARELLPATPIHKAGEFLLGHVNDSGFNVFGLPMAPEEVRSFFADSSFGILRVLRQDVDAFDNTVNRWCSEVSSELRKPVSADWIRAKLCGRWPSGEALRPEQFEPEDGDFNLDFRYDGAGSGCPWASHVRRMRSDGNGDAHQRERNLLRRGMPFGAASWDDHAPKVEERGLLGLFFCASLEDQFEHLLGQWANRRPLGAPDLSDNKDAFSGQHEDDQARMLLPLHGAAQAVSLSGFQPWTQTLGTLYAWHPSRNAVHRILDQDYLEPDTEGPWL